MIHAISESAAVMYSTLQIPSFSRQDAQDLMEKARKESPAGTLRLCLHPDTDALLHEMIIVHPQSARIRPHRHVGKEMGIILYEGTMDVTIFEEDGTLLECIHMGDYNSGLAFQCRIPVNKFFSQTILSKQALFYEVLRGPFEKYRIEYADFDTLGG